MSSGGEEAAPDPAKGLRQTFRAFGYRDFRLMWMGAFTSTTGTWTQQVAQAWLVWELTMSPFYLGLTAFVGELPFILFTLVGGAVADRVDRRKLLLCSQFVQMGTAFILTFLVFFELVAIWHLLVLVFLAGTAQAFGGPAYMALLPNLVRREHLPNAIALNSTQFNLARMLGPTLAGVLMEGFGAVYCFAFNGLTFLAVIASLLRIQTPFQGARAPGSVWHGVRSGLFYLLEKRSIWQLSLLGFIQSFFAVPLLTLLPVFANTIFSADAGIYSTMMAFSGAGSVTGALLYAHYSTDSNRRGRVTLLFQLTFSLLLVAFSQSSYLPLSLGLLFLAGMSMMVLIASVNSLVQLATSDEMRGRVMSVFMLSFRGGMSLGNLATGASASLTSPPAALLLNALILCGVGMAFLLSKSRIREL